MTLFLSLLTVTLGCLHLCLGFGGGLDSILNSEGLFGEFSVLSEAGIASVLNDRDAVSKAYSSFASQNGKEANSQKLDTFQANLKKIAAHNLQARKLGGFELGVNQFSDMSVDEVVRQSTGYIPNNNSFSAQASSGTPKKPPPVKWSSPPASLDWRTYKMVSSVKDQKGCGACVYFAATALHESAHALWHNGQILDLSEQELVDCARGNGNNGCNGGTFVPTFDYLQKKGQTTEGNYKYSGSDMDDGWDNNECRAGELEGVSKISGWWPVKPATDENSLKNHVALYGPAAVAIHVNSGVMQYKKGVFDAECKGGRNHAVLVVGYGSENGKEFWIVKNSWGERYGEKGYIRLGRNKNNLCDIAGDAVVVNA